MTEPALCSRLTEHLLLMLLSVACVDISSCTHQQVSFDLLSPLVIARPRSGRSLSQSALRATWSRSRPSHCGLVYHKRSLQCLSRSSEAPDTESEPAERDMSDLSSFDNRAVLSGQLCLCGVAILWGSYSPVVRYIYSCSGPPTPAALTAVRTVIQAFVLLVSDLVLRRQQYGSPAKAKTRRPSSSPTFSRRQEALPSSSNNILNTISRALQSTSSKLWIAGAELGFWNFCGSTFQALGLQYTTATRGAFLIQVKAISGTVLADLHNSMALKHSQHYAIACASHCLHRAQATSLLTPVMATLAGEKPSRGVWLGCCCTLTGTVLITLDHSASAVSNHGSPAAASSLGIISA